MPLTLDMIQSHYPDTRLTSPSCTPLSLSAKRGAASSIFKNFGMPRPGAWDPERTLDWLSRFNRWVSMGEFPNPSHKILLILWPWLVFCFSFILHHGLIPLRGSTQRSWCLWYVDISKICWYVHCWHYLGINVIRNIGLDYYCISPYESHHEKTCLCKGASACASAQSDQHLYCSLPR